MTGDVFQALFDRFAVRYGVNIGDKTRSKYRGDTYDIPDEDADALFEDVCKQCLKLPDAAKWSRICREYRTSTRIVENAEKCLACNDDGYVFWTEHHNSMSGICPFCERGASLKKRFPKSAFADSDIATAVKQRNEYLAEKDSAKRRSKMATHLIFMATTLKGEIEI